MSKAIVDKLGGEEGDKALILGDLVVKPIRSNHLIPRPISDGARLFFPACDGSETIADAHDVFKSGISMDFKRWGLSGPSEATIKTSAEVYDELRSNSLTKELFTFLSPCLDFLCVTGHQIRSFCKEHSDWLCDEDYETFFITKKNWKVPANFDNLFVAYVYVLYDGLYLSVYQFERDFMRLADGPLRRLVVPQLVA